MHILLTHVDSRMAARPFSLYRFLLRHSVTATAAFLLFAVGTTSFAAQSSLPGERLYSIKRDVNERLLGTLQVTSEQKSTWQSKLAEERLAEAIILKSENRLSDDIKNDLNEEFEAHARKAKETIAQDDAMDAIESASKLEARLKGYKRLLSELKEEDDDDEVLDIDEEITKTEKFRTELEDRVKKQTPKPAVEGKIKAAENVIKTTERQLERKKSLSEEDREEFKQALESVKNAREHLDNQEFDEAFSDAQAALRSAQEVRTYIEKSGRFEKAKEKLEKEREKLKEELKNKQERLKRERIEVDD